MYKTMATHMLQEKRPAAILGLCVNDLVRLEEYLGELDEDIAVQVFVRGPTNFTDTEACNKRELLKGRHVLVHAAFVSNPWRGARGSLYNIGAELKHCAYIGARGYILHLGPDMQDTLELVLTFIRRHVDPASTLTVFFEINSTHPSDNSFETPEKINAIFDKIYKHAEGIKVGLCVDTAHLFACGVSLATKKAAREWLGRLRPDLRVMFHLNDSSEPLGSGRDKHAGLCEGNIWGDYEVENSGIAAVMEFAAAHGCYVILEQPFDVALRGIAKVRALR
jgi:deoxyribonuclease-4